MKTSQTKRYRIASPEPLVAKVVDWSQTTAMSPLAKILTKLMPTKSAGAFCGYYCYLYVCNSSDCNSCCPGAPNLFRCQNACTGTVDWYCLSSACSGFCGNHYCP
jgi:hypothetical protein